MKHGRYCLTVICLLICAVVLLDSAPAEADLCCTKKEERFDNWPLYEHSGDNCNVYVTAQSFKPQHDYVLCKVWVVLDTEPGGTSATLYVQDGPGAGANVYTQASISGMSGNKWFEFDVPDTTVFQDQDYYIRVTGEVLWRKYQILPPDTGDPYPRGHAYLNGNKIDDYMPGKTDYWFITYTYEECQSSRVEISSFAVTASAGYAEMTWTTTTEIDNAGFNLYRSSTGSDSRTRLNQELIPAMGDEIRGASYSFTDYNVKDGVTYRYWLESKDLNGDSSIEGPVLVTVGERETPAPAFFNLAQNCPNPFNPVTEIMYELPVDCKVSLEIYNVAGRRVATLVNEYQPAGSRVAGWDGRDANGLEVSSGVYFYKLQAAGFTEIRKMVLLR